MRDHVQLPEGRMPLVWHSQMLHVLSIHFGALTDNVHLQPNTPYSERLKLIVFVMFIIPAP